MALENVEFYPVTSSNVAEIGYDDEDQELYVKFNNGALYCYYQVPPFVWEQFLNTESKGKFIHSDLKGIYGYARIN